eukprot:gene10737-2827_t
MKLCAGAVADAVSCDMSPLHVSNPNSGAVRNNTNNVLT